MLALHNNIKIHCNSTSHLKAVEDSRKNGKQARLIDLRMGPSRTQFTDQVSLYTGFFLLPTLYQCLNAGSVILEFQNLDPYSLLSYLSYAVF